MKESMRKPVLFFMDLMVVFLAVILTIELIAIAGFTFPFMETGHRTSAFLRRIQDQEYQKCVEYYYENEANGVEPDEELKECYGVAKYYEAAWQRMLVSGIRGAGACKRGRSRNGSCSGRNGRAAASAGTD